MTTYLSFVDVEVPPTRKTRIVNVMSLQGGYVLGQIRWYANWRQYTFYPDQATIWNTGCLGMIVDKLNDMNRQHRLSRSAS